MTKDVVILGGGFGGVAVARQLRRATKDGLRVTLVNENNYTTFSPMLPEVVSSAVLPGQVIAPLRQMLGQNQRFVMGRALQVDFERRRLIHSFGEDTAELAFDHLVFALGARAALDVIPGMAEHGIPLKLIGDALRVRNRVIARLERADLVSDPQDRRRLTHFVVVGGGFSGVEVAGEIHDFVRAAARFYPHVQPDEMRVSIVHMGDRLLPELPARLAEKAYASMTRRGIDIHLRAKVTSADATGLDVAYADGSERRLEAATSVLTIGTGTNPLLETLDLPTRGGRLLVDADLSVQGHDDIWALGDCAVVPNAATDAPAPPTAQFAVREARAVAGNIRAVEAGRPTRAFDYAGLGTIATIGCKRGIADVMGVPVSGFAAWLLWRAFYLLQMPTFSRKARLWGAWTWDMFFRSDVAQLDYAASGDVDRQWRQARETRRAG